MKEFVNISRICLKNTGRNLMYTFKYSTEDQDTVLSLSVSKTVELKTNTTDTLTDLCHAFEDFLRGCGHQFEGTIEIVTEDTNSIDFFND
jgi:hypothetical protein